MLIEFLGALFRGCARVSLSIFDREKNSLDRERIFFPVKIIFPCQVQFFPVNNFFPCQVLNFFPCQFLMNSSEITTINSYPYSVRGKSDMINHVPKNLKIFKIRPRKF